MTATPDAPARCPVCGSFQIVNENSMDGFWKWRCRCRAVFVIASKEKHEWLARAREAEAKLARQQNQELQSMATRAFGDLPDYNPLPLPAFLR